MATEVWQGQATAVKQVNTITPANVQINDVFGITLTNAAVAASAITFTATAATVANVTAGLLAAANVAKAALQAPWDEVTAADATTALTITVITSGVPFTVATTATNGGDADTQTLTSVVTTACSGLMTNTTCWRSADTPDSADSANFPAGCSNPVTPMDYSAVLLVDTTFESGFTGLIGVDNGSDAPGYLKVDSDTINLNNVSQTFLWFVNTTTVNVNAAKNSPGTGRYGCNLRGDVTTLNIELTNAQSVGIAALPGETATFTTINISGAGTVTIGEGVTVTTVNISGTGTVYNHVAATEVNILSGTPKVYHEKGRITTCNQYAGSLYIDAAGTVGAPSITTLNAYGSVYVEGSGARYVATVNRYADLPFEDLNKKLAWTTAQFNNNTTDAQLRLGNHYTIVRA